MSASRSHVTSLRDMQDSTSEQRVAMSSLLDLSEQCGTAETARYARNVYARCVSGRPECFLHPLHYEESEFVYWSRLSDPFVFMCMFDVCCGLRCGLESGVAITNWAMFRLFGASTASRSSRATLESQCWHVTRRHSSTAHISQPVR